MTEFPWRLVTTDIDGTLTRVHGWSVIAQVVGKSREYEAVNREFAAGGVSEDVHLRRLLRLAVGAPWSAVRTALEETPRVRHIRESIHRLHRLGTRVALLTHNPGYVCTWYLKTFGFDGFAGTPGAPLRHGRVGPLGRTRADKWRGMRSLLRQFMVQPGRAVHVGDGLPDALVFHRVGGGVAFNSRSPRVERAADLSIHSDDMAVLVERLKRLVPRLPDERCI